MPNIFDGLNKMNNEKHQKMRNYRAGFQTWNVMWQTKNRQNC